MLHIPDSPDGSDYAEYSDDPQYEKKPFRSRIFKFLKYGILISSLVLGTTVAATININAGQNREFGQGIAVPAACSGTQKIYLTPVSEFKNSENKFAVNKIKFAHIPDSCIGKDFVVALYSDSSVLELDTNVQSARILYKGASTTRIYSGSSGTNTFSSTISDVIVSGGFGEFVINLTGVLPSANLVKKISLQSMETGASAGGMGTLASPGDSAYQIHHDYPAAPDGLYWISNPNINSGSPVQIYADMTRDGGGWTLIVANATNIGWDATNTLLANSTNPPTDPTYSGAIGNSASKYSILAWADYLKKSDSGFQYRMEANTYGRWGGIWTANQPYSFVSQSEFNMDITLDTKFNPSDWTYPIDNGIEARMPFYQPSQCYLLSTTNDNWWWGTIISGCGWTPAPWLEGTGGQDPGIIWYWVR